MILNWRSLFKLRGGCGAAGLRVCCWHRVLAVVRSRGTGSVSSRQAAPETRQQSLAFIGTAGWSYEDWKGIVYPKPAPRGFKPLAYLSGYFDCVEVNVTFYRVPAARTAEGWVEQVSANPRFRFSVKVPGRFTHEKASAEDEEERKRFLGLLEPLQESGRLGAVLLQFPWSFRLQKLNIGRLRGLVEVLEGLPLVVEVRHGSWGGEQAEELLQELGASLCSIDQPTLSGGLPPAARLTGPIGYVRLHGRNVENWFKKEAGRDARYDYLYGEAELQEWVQRIRALLARAETVFVITNNHFRGQAPTNALQLRAKLEGGRVEVPEPLLAAFPQLGGVSRTASPPRMRQGELPF